VEVRGQLPPPPQKKKLVCEKEIKKIFFSENTLPKNAKFGAENPHFQGIQGGC